MFKRGESAYPGVDIMRNLYLAQKLSIREIGEALGVCKSTARCWLQLAGIERRSIAEAKKGQKPAKHTVEASVSARRKRTIEGKSIVGYKISGDGYVLLYMPKHSFTCSRGYVREHRYIMEQHLGRLLLPTEDVHHSNGVRDDNRIENLELKGSRAEHLREHYAERQIDKATGRFLPVAKNL